MNLEIKLIYLYYKENNNANKIFGNTFVKNNKDNIELIINGNKSKLIGICNLKEGENKIQIIIINQLTNLEEMFYECSSLKILKN